MGDITALLGRADELFDRGITEVQERQRRVRRVGAFPLGRLVFFLVLVSRPWLDLPRHSFPPDVRPRPSITTALSPVGGASIAGERLAPREPRRFGALQSQGSRLSPD